MFKVEKEIRDKYESHGVGSSISAVSRAKNGPVVSSINIDKGGEDRSSLVHCHITYYSFGASCHFFQTSSLRAVGRWLRVRFRESLPLAPCCLLPVPAHA